MKHLVRTLLKVVHRVAQVIPLRVVQVDHIRTGANRQRFLIRAVIIVTVDINLFVYCINYSPERHAVLNLLIVKHLVRTLLKVVHRVAQVIPLRVVQVDHIRTGANRQRFRIRAGIIMTGDVNFLISRLNYRTEPHVRHSLRRSKNLRRVLIQIVDRVAVQITLVFDFYNGRAIRPNFLLFKRLGSKALDSISLRIGRLANRAFERLIRIVGILNIGCAVYGLKAMLNSVGSLIELEVQLQHQRAVACDGAGLNVIRGLIIHVLAVFLSRLIGVGNGNFRVRGGRALVAVVERVSTIRVLIVELDGVLGVGVRRPDGVEDVRAVVVYLHRVARFDGAFALGVGVPALEGVADAGEGVGGLGGDGRVIGEVFNHVLACAAVGLIGQGCASGTRAPLGGEGDDVPFIGVIALDLILIAGLVGGRAVRPAEEVLAISSNQLARGHEVSKAALRVGLAIHRSGYVVLAGNIFYSEGAVLGVVGVEGDVRCDSGLGVEGLAGAILAGTPAAPGKAFANLRHDFRLLIVQRGFNRVALRDVECNR